MCAVGRSPCRGRGPKSRPVDGLRARRAVLVQHRPDRLQLLRRHHRLAVGLAAHLRQADGKFRGAVLPRRHRLGLFVKGTIGAGSIGGGNLYDEDFPPGIAPYSKTSSDTSGSLNFGNIDVGYSFVHVPQARLGAFVGYGRRQEVVNAGGCTQIAGNLDICVPALPPSLQVIQESDTWNLLRVGMTADLMLGDRLRLSGEAAYVWASQKAVDNHFFTFGIDPAAGNGSGYQLEAILAYQLTEAFNIGVGGRWWHLDTRAIDSFDQLLTYNTDRYGVFVQAGLKLN